MLTFIQYCKVANGPRVQEQTQTNQLPSSMRGIPPPPPQAQQPSTQAQQQQPQQQQQQQQPQQIQQPPQQQQTQQVVQGLFRIRQITTPEFMAVLYKAKDWAPTVTQMWQALTTFKGAYESWVEHMEKQK